MAAWLTWPCSRTGNGLDHRDRMALGVGARNHSPVTATVLTAATAWRCRSGRGIIPRSRRRP